MWLLSRAGHALLPPSGRSIMYYTLAIYSLTVYYGKMKTVNALRIRNQLGEVLEMLDSEHEPILIEKRKKIRAVLISYHDYQTRFMDKLADEERRKFISQIESHSAGSLIATDPMDTLRSLRGYVD